MEHRAEFLELSKAVALVFASAPQSFDLFSALVRVVVSLIIMASGWAYLRKHWIKPEVYPLIGSMAAALGVCGAALINKASDPTLGWNKSKRKTSLYDEVEEVVPMWSSAKKNSTRIFGASREIMESKESYHELPDPVTVKIGEEEEAEEEEEEAPVEEQPAVEATQATAVEDDTPAVEASSADDIAADAVKTAVDVIDEKAETINSAIDAAIESAAATVSTESAKQAVPSVLETALPTYDAQPTAAES